MERFAGDMAVTVLLSYLVILGILAIGCIATNPLRELDVYSWKTAWNELSMACVHTIRKNLFPGRIMRHFVLLKKKEIRNPGI